MEMPEDQRQRFHLRSHRMRDLPAICPKSSISSWATASRCVGDIYPVQSRAKSGRDFRGSGRDPIAVFNYDYLRDALPVGRRNYISVVAVLAEVAEDVPRIAKAVDDMFENSSPPTKTESEQQFALEFCLVSSAISSCF